MWPNYKPMIGTYEPTIHFELFIEHIVCTRCKTPTSDTANIIFPRKSIFIISRVLVTVVGSIISIFNLKGKARHISQQIKEKKCVFRIVNRWAYLHLTLDAVSKFQSRTLIFPGITRQFPEYILSIISASITTRNHFRHQFLSTIQLRLF